MKQLTFTKYSARQIKKPREQYSIQVLRDSVSSPPPRKMSIYLFHWLLVCISAFLKKSKFHTSVPIYA